MRTVLAPHARFGRHALPAEMNSFIGRSNLINEAGRLLGSARLVTLIGTGGVGKTRLMLRLANELAETGGYRHGVVVVRLTDLKAADSRLEATIASALGILDNSSTPALARVIDYLRHRHVLLMLDNCEHLVGQSPGSGQVPRMLTALLMAAPNLQVIATSRVRLGVQGEHLLIVPPLCVGDAGSCGPGEHGKVHEATQLLLDRATEVGVEIDKADYALAEQLCRLLDGLPLAIELAAVQLDTMTLRELIDHHDPLRLLVDGTSEQRHHRTLRATLDWSYELLSTAERRAWALVSVFEGGFDLDGATAICRGRGVEADDVRSLLARLVRKSLLRVDRAVDGAPASTRYRMLTTIRQYGLELAAASGEETELRLAHAEYFATLADTCAREWFGPEEVTWKRRMRAELHNLRAAQNHLLSDPATAPRGLELAVNATRTCFCFVAGKVNESHLMLSVGLDANPNIADPLQVNAAALIVWIAQIQGNHGLAGRMLDQASRQARELGSEETSAALLYCRGTQLWLAEPDPDKAQQCLEYFARAEHMFRGQGALGDASMAMLFTSMAAGFYSDRDTAVRESARLLALCREVGAQWSTTWALWACALAEAQFGDAYHASVLVQQALRIQHDLCDLWGPAWSVWLLAVIAVKLGEYSLASQLFGGSELIMINASAVGLVPFLRVQHEAEAAARRELGDDEFEILREMGGSLSTEEVLAMALCPLTPRPRPRAFPGGLSAREFEVASLLAAGRQNREIAGLLRISHRTVEVHVSRIMAKLKLGSRLEVASWYLTTVVDS